MNATAPGRRTLTLQWAWFSLILLMLAPFHVGRAANETETHLRVAMMDFTSDDGLMRSADGAAQWSILAQDALTRQEPGIDWIERAQLQTAADELNLSAGGFTSADGSLRVGKWLKADLAILGGFTRNDKDDAGHTLRLEVVDLDRADTLATRTIQVDGDRREAITADPALVPGTATALREALAEAREKLGRAAHQIVVAPLFFQNADPSPRLDNFGSTLLDAFSRAADEAGDVRVLCFPQADEARGEAELVVSGLSESDADAWQRVAGLYVWGSYRELPAPGKAFAQTPVEIELTLWDGVSPARTSKQETVVAELPALSRRLAGQCLDAARHAPASRPDAPAAREEIARSLCEQGKRLAAITASHDAQHDAFRDTPAGKTLLQQQNLLLGAACFFAPGNHEVQFARLHARWEGFPAPIQRLPLLDLWRRSNDLADYAERFGGSDADMPFVRVHADQYMVKRLHEGEEQIHVTGSEPNLPPDATDAHIAAWHAALEERFAHDAEVYVRTASQQPLWNNEDLRLMGYVNWMQAAMRAMRDPARAARVVEAIWPLYQPLYQKHPAAAERIYGTMNGGIAADLPSLYERLGKPGRAVAMLASLSSGASDPSAAFPDAAPPPAVRLLRLKAKAAFFSVDPDDKVARSDPGIARHFVNTLSVGADDRLWMSIGHIGGTLENGAPREPSQELWCFDPALQRLSTFAVEALTFQTPITAILPQPDRLWLGVDFHGVAEYDLDKEQVARRYTVADGLVNDSVDDITTAADGRMYFAGHENGQPLLNGFDPAQKAWNRITLSSFQDQPVNDDITPAQRARFMLPPSAQVVACKHWLLVGSGSHWALVDTEDARARPLREVLPASQQKWLDVPPTIGDAKAKGRTPYAGLPPRCPRPCAADAGGYWLAVGGTLLRFDPAQPDAAKSFPLPAEYADGLTALVSDGEDVWSLGMLDPAMAADGGRRPVNGYIPGVATVMHSPRAFVAAMHAADGHWRGGFEMPGVPGCLALSHQSLYVGLQMTLTPLIEINKPVTLASAPR